MSGLEKTEIATVCVKIPSALQLGINAAVHITKTS